MTDALFAEVVSSARAVLPGTALGERAAWVSSALALWREPGVAEDPVADDEAFVAWLADHREPITELLLATVGSLGLGEASRRAGSVVVPTPPPSPERAWRLDDGDSHVVALEFLHGADDREVLLVDVGGDGVLRGITFVTEADGFVRVAAEHGSVVEIGVGVAAAEAAAGLERRAESPGCPTDDELANVVLLRARLGLLGEVTTEPRWYADFPLPVVDRDADVAAAQTLRSALADVIAATAPPEWRAMVDPVGELVRWEPGVGRPVQELEALATLEWADWLGAVIGVVRAGEGAPVSGEILVDYVNRCPEVTSAIPKRDRAWFAWAFGVAIETWRDLGVVDDELRLTPAGRWVLPQALVAAWTSSRAD